MITDSQHIETDSQHTEQIISTPSLHNGRGQGVGLLVLRFSALGDVAMTVPVVKALALARPDVHITVASRPFARAFYEGLAANVEFVGIDLKDGRYRGIFGVEHLYQDLHALRPDMVADLHDVLRTKYARWRFRMAGIPVAHIDKNRRGRREITRREGKVLSRQKTAFGKYHDVFRSLGFEFTLGNDAPLTHHPSPTTHHLSIGIAPSAAHKGKIYPVDMMEQVIASLRESHPDLRILLFGGKQDREVFDRWCGRYEGVSFASGKCRDLRGELAMMQQLRCMVTMDSGNMHLASLVGTPVVSVWGATHPYAGFMGWGQSEDDAVQVSLPCRPCSIYGNKPCLRGDYACMGMIKPQDIVRKIEKYLSNQ